MKTQGIKQLSGFLILLITILQSSCGQKKKENQILLGNWVEYKVDRLGAADYSSLLYDSTSVSEKEEEKIHRHLEFYKNGIGKEWYIPEDAFDINYSVNDSILTIGLDNYVFQKVNKDELILKELKQEGEINSSSSHPRYNEIVFYKRFKK